MQAQMLAPAAVLVVWSLIMLLWTAGTRFPAMAKSGMDLKNAAPGGRGQDLEGVIPDKVNWKSHNYTHLAGTADRVLSGGYHPRPDGSPAGNRYVCWHGSMSGCRISPLAVAGSGKPHPGRAS